MLHSVKAACFNSNDHQLFAHHRGVRRMSSAQAKQCRENRRLIQIYLFKIQQRIDRGALSGALQLFNRLVKQLDLPYWAVAALRCELRKPAN